MNEAPRKLFFRIGEVSLKVGVEPHVLRYWETEFRSIRPTKSAKGQRIYSAKHVESLMKVKELLYGHGFTIAGARKKLREGGVEPPAPEQTVSTAEMSRIRQELGAVREVVVEALDELSRELDALARR